MGRRTEVPITPDVLRWAVAESGISIPEVSEAAGVDVEEFEAWLQDHGKPSVTQIKRVATKLHRQVAVFLLPAVPAEARLQIEFRHPIGQEPRALTAVERRYLRRARRLQEAHAWLIRELERGFSELPIRPLSTNPEQVADSVRSHFAITVADQARWKNASVAFDAWRGAVESLGVTVVLFPMGVESCRGFSLWDDASPLIAVNTAWRDEARIYTLFHELGHLVTRTNSACSESPATPDARDPVERWCEEFSAALLMPRESIRETAQVSDLQALARLARAHKVSLRAMAIRLIGLSKATWALYRDIPAASDAKTQGGSGGTGRNRREIRQDELGARGTEIFVAAVQRDIISESQALDYLDIPAVEFERLRSEAGTVST
jgi:Zn-dependent peptidase ImmA (M78 family)